MKNIIIANSDINDLTNIFEIYRSATEYMKSKNQVAWPEFEKKMIVEEIKNMKQWKLLINQAIACIWATTLNDELIWGKRNDEPSLYLHRIATAPDYRGQNLVRHVIKWADDYCKSNKLKYIRMDTGGLNEGLIKYYENLGFEFLSAEALDETNDLPQHYSNVPICLFQRTP